MLIHEVARKYASALFQAAKEKSLIDASYAQMNDFRAFITKDKNLLRFLTAPQIGEDEKIALVREALGNSLDQLFVEFLVVLIEKGRIGYLESIIDEFNRQVEAHKGIGRATVFTAVPLNDDERRRLTERLAAVSGLNIRTEQKIDKSIIAGIIVIMHNQIIDGSVRHSLLQIQEQLLHVRVH
jgi:F-type H+-transporting ATPase subunit delta